MSHQIKQLGFLLVCLILNVKQVGAQTDAFITTWQTNNPGTSSETQITIPTIGSGYDFVVDWGDGSMDSGVTGSITHTYGQEGTYTVSITGSFPRIYFSNGGDSEKLITIEQWGTSIWTSMNEAFAGCTNLTVSATDIPNLSMVSDARGMFFQCESLTCDFSQWDVSAVADMSGMFFGAAAFNGDLSNWDVSNVTDMESMFLGAAAFNGDIGSWNVSSVANMSTLLSEASAFNQELSGWDVSSVTDMSRMFDNATSFNGNIGNWDVGNVTDMNGMFEGATSFNQNLSNWNVANVANMSAMFVNSGLSSIAYDIMVRGWANLVSLQTNVTLGAPGNTYCQAAEARDRLIGEFSWSIADGGSSCSEYFITTWQTDNEGNSDDNQITIPTSGNGYDYHIDWGDGNLDLNSTGSLTHSYETPGAYTVYITGNFPSILFNNSGDKDKILDVQQWGDNSWLTFASAFRGCSNLVVSASDAPDLSRVLSMSFMFNSATALTGDFSAWDVSNVVAMRNLFTGAPNFNSDLSGWDVGNVRSILNMFNGARSFTSDLSRWNINGVTSLSGMFFNAIAFNSDLNGWDVSQVTSMSNVFNGAPSFNGNISDWDVSRVEDMRGMFRGAAKFNGDISNWDVSQVTTMNAMFFNASLFGGDISNWDVSNVTSMSELFKNAVNFTSDLSGWDVGNVTNMVGLVDGAVTFDSDLSGWDVTNVLTMFSMLNNSGLSSENYDKLLLSWSKLPGLNSTIPLGARGLSYCFGKDARDKLIDDFGWTIIDDGENCPAFFITTWKTDNEGASEDNQITIPTIDIDQDYTVLWGDGTVDFNVSGNITHTYDTPGTYTVSIAHRFNQIYFFNSGDKDKILTVEQWGEFPWTSMGSAFRGCSNLVVNATDVPDLSRVTNLSFMFEDATALTGDFSQWNTSFVRTTKFMFKGASNFTSDLSGWDVSEVVSMVDMFNGASTFESDLSTWNTSSVTSTSGMFFGASSFVSDLSSWDMAQVTDMSNMFNDAVNFNSDLSTWDVSNTTDMVGMFRNAESFNSNLGDWDVQNVTNMSAMLSNSGLSTQNYTRTLNGWGGMASLQENVLLGADGLQYCGDNNSRTSLIADSGWIISGDESTACSSETDILEFALSGQSGDPVIDVVAHTVLAVVNFGTGLTELNPEIVVSEGASISPGSGQPQDFTQEITYTVIAQDGTAQDWIVTVAEQQTQSISFDEIENRVYGDPSINLTASATSGLDVTYSISSGNEFVSLDGNELLLVGAGDVTITATQPGNTFFNEATDVDRTFTIEKSLLTVTAEEKMKVYGVENPVLTISYSGFVNDEDVDVLEILPTITTETETLSDVGQYSITSSGGEAANYNFAHVEGVLTVTKATLTVTADNLMRTYGEVNPDLSISYAGFVNDQDINVLDQLPTLSTDADEFSIVGNYDIVPSGGIDDNYTFDYITGTLTVNKANLTITAEDKTVAYGVSIPDLTKTYMGFVGTDDESVLDEIPVIDADVAQFDDTGEYDISLTGGADHNYEFTLLQGTLTINKAVLEGTADDLMIVYGEAIPALTISYVGFAGQDDESVLDVAPELSTSARQFDDVNEYEITVSGGSDNNYEFSFIDGTLTVTQAVLEAKAEAKVVTFGESIPPLTIAYNGFVGNDDKSSLDEIPTVSTAAEQLDDVGTYAITLLGGNDNNYSFSLTDGILTIVKAVATVTISNLDQTFDGTPKEPAVATDPEGLQYTITYNGTQDNPVDAGTYEVDVHVDELNYEGQATAVFIILQEPLSVRDNFNLNIYPNPATDFIKIESAVPVRLLLFDNSGHYLREITSTELIDMSDWNPGLYLFQFFNQNEELISTRRILKK